MNTICLICGRLNNDGMWETKIPTDPSAIRNQIENLDELFEDLANGEEKVASYVNVPERLCPMCIELTEGVRNEKDKITFMENINQQISALEEWLNEQLPGFK